VIFVDTNVFAIEKRYRRDPHFRVNHRFLEALRKKGGGATTPVNLLEFAGILSFSLNPGQLAEAVRSFPEHFGVAIVPALDPREGLLALPLARLFRRISAKCSFGDALVLELAEAHAEPGSQFVTWDAKHFLGKTSLDVLTPAQALARR
jgi:predicted nucleic acid-binding protein